MRIAVTGHRPAKLNCGTLSGYDPANQRLLRRFAEQVVLRHDPNDLWITGMALGWDMAIASACCDHAIFYHCYVPCDDQERLWSPKQRSEYRELIAGATAVKKTAPGPYEPWKMLHRDMAMVDEATKVVALFNGETAGGTYHTWQYANDRAGLDVENVWTEWVTYQRQRCSVNLKGYTEVQPCVSLPAATPQGTFDFPR